MRTYLPRLALATATATAFAGATAGAADSRRGDANGEGFKDVGTWHAVAPSH